LLFRLPIKIVGGWFRITAFLDRYLALCYQILSLTCEATGENVTKNSKVFDIIVLAGMVVNIILAVFLILYYFDFL